VECVRKRSREILRCPQLDHKSMQDEVALIGGTEGPEINP